MSKRTIPAHPIYCSCCPVRPVVMAEKLGDHLLEIQSRKHGRTHVAVIVLDKFKDEAIDSKTNETAE